MGEEGYTPDNYARQVEFSEAYRLNAERLEQQAHVSTPHQSKTTQHDPKNPTCTSCHHPRRRRRDRNHHPLPVHRSRISRLNHYLLSSAAFPVGIPIGVAECYFPEPTHILN